MTREFLPSIGPNRGPRLPIVGLLAILVPLAASAAAIRFIQIRWVRPLNIQAAALRRNLESEQEAREALGKEIDRLNREVGALQAISRVEILWGGAASDTDRVAFPYARPSGATYWAHPITDETLWYYTDKDDTLSRIAAHPRVLGAAHLWPILARENGLRVSGADPLPGGRLVRIPARINEYQIRSAVTEAGAPDEQRDAIFAQAGLSP